MNQHVAANAELARPAMNTRIALVAVTAIFFMWSQFCCFGAYLVMAIPAGRVLDRVGDKLGIFLGLLVAGAGALLILPAAQLGSFYLFLPALFILASGIVLLQCSANPYVALLG